MSQAPARRTVLQGAALVGAAGLGAVACSPSGKTASPVPTEPVALGAASDVPVGGAKLYREQRLLVSQPTKGQYKCFGAACTHQGCVLDKIDKREGGHCPCHGSRFDVTTGAVLQGPATQPLPEVPVKVEGGKLIAG
ncbi:Rieske (2Fe-2S) protein [Streptomyces sp. NPDC003077]|uniref:Rieske (2Fe-2S) protein n=1 Tax=Streptomyces sp. NPDC003077 TaxID=3154443 RepID=UPI0033AFB27D